MGIQLVLIFAGAVTTAPTPALSPSQVVEAQLVALSQNDEPKPNAGIALAFRFASPANKKATGPLEKFIGIVNSEAYAPMINNQRFEVSEGIVEGSKAVVPVELFGADGRRYRYAFLLERQAAGEWQGCWMTDAVQLVAKADVRAPGGIEL